MKTPITKKIAKLLEKELYAEIMENFETESFYGDPWTPTNDIAFRHNTMRGKMLQLSGDFKKSVQVIYNKMRSAFIVNAEFYGFYHQYGLNYRKLPARKWMPDIGNKKSKVMDKLTKLLADDLR